MPHDRWTRAHESLKTVKTAAELRNFVVRLPALYGLKHVAFHAVSVPGLDDAAVLIPTYPQEWISRYVEQDYFLIDPILTAAAAGILPIDWSQLTDLDDSVRAFFEEAFSYGVGPCGMSFPARGPSGDFSLLSVDSDLGPEAWSEYTRIYMRDLHMLAYLLHAKVIELHGAAPSRGSLLSMRERQVLELGAQGLTNKRISQKLEVSERAVRAYFESARRKLDCANRGHVLAKAAALHLIHRPALWCGDPAAAENSSRASLG
jgi:DNA-binding CsgD family transcriptional regulator